MSRLFQFILIISIAPFTISCSRWTEKQKQEFSQKCSQTDTINYLPIALTGFDFEQIENICVEEIHDSEIIDTFYIQPDKRSFDSLRTRYYTSINRTIYIHDTYVFIIPEEKPYVLSGMKMIMWPEFTMFSEGYGCIMGDYKLNGVRFEHDNGPDLVKH